VTLLGGGQDGRFNSKADVASLFKICGCQGHFPATPEPEKIGEFGNAPGDGVHHITRSGRVLLREKSAMCTRSFVAASVQRIRI
jgi:hypothetical protein